VVVDVRCREVDGRFGSDDVICIPLLNVCNQSLTAHHFTAIYSFPSLICKLQQQRAILTR
jgi:hypothetical protein